MSDRKSFIAGIEERILKLVKLDYMDSKEKVDDYIRDRLNAGEKPVKSVFKSTDFDGMQVFTFGDGNGEHTILYMHGGAYINEINYQHLLYCFLMSRKLNADVLAPVYPLAPLHNAEDAYDVLVPFYEKLIQRGNLILMGDSAGGGLAHSFCQYLKTLGLSQPERIITFSPWVDVSMSNPPYNSSDDPVLGEIGLKEIAKSWAGHLSTTDYRVSPLFGDNAGLPDTLIFVGTGEIFHGDIRRYVENLERDGVNVELVEGEGMFHIYPLFPSPEARRAFKKIREIIK